VASRTTQNTSDAIAEDLGDELRDESAIGPTSSPRTPKRKIRICSAVTENVKTPASDAGTKAGLLAGLLYMFEDSELPAKSSLTSRLLEPHFWTPSSDHFIQSSTPRYQTPIIQHLHGASRNQPPHLLRKESLKNHHPRRRHLAMRAHRPSLPDRGCQLRQQLHQDPRQNKPVAAVFVAHHYSDHSSQQISS
jgi:hypothetical protein